MAEETENLPSKRQIEAAQELYKDPKMKYWQLEDKLMGKLKKTDPNIRKKAATLVKVTLVNAFYSAGCDDVDSVTTWMVEQKPTLLENYKNISNSDKNGYIQFVLRIARYKEKPEEIKLKDISKGIIVFASKFSHFFIDSEKFPIFDQYAAMMVDFHLGSSGTGKDYAAFYENFFKLKTRLEERYKLLYTTKAIDHYLWLSGMYVAWKRWKDRTSNSSLNIYPPAESLFKDASKNSVNTLFPDALLQSFPQELLTKLQKWIKAKNQEKEKLRKAEERKRKKEEKEMQKVEERKRVKQQ